MTDTEPRLRPMGLGLSILYFGIPSLLFTASIMGLLPWMIRHGHSQAFTFLVTFGVPLGGLLVAALVAHRLEGRTFTWPSIRDRMRLRKPTGRDWLWIAGLVALSQFAGKLWGPVAALFSGIRFFTPPSEFVTVMTGLGSGTFGGLDMSGRWDLLVLTALIMVVIGVAGEELWWRGIILPRQELAFGKWAWLVNALLWDLFHAFNHNNAGSIVGYMVATLPLAFVAQQTRNTWPGIISHGIGNSAVVRGMLSLVMA